MKKLWKAARKAVRQFFSINKLFSRFIIIFCLWRFDTVVNRVLHIAESGITTVNYYQIIVAAAGVYGGELILLAFKDISAKKASAGATENAAATGSIKTPPDKNIRRDC